MKHIKRKFFTSMLTLCMVLIMTPAAALADEGSTEISGTAEAEASAATSAGSAAAESVKSKEDAVVLDETVLSKLPTHTRQVDIASNTNEPIYSKVYVIQDGAVYRLEKDLVLDGDIQFVARCTIYMDGHSITTPADKAHNLTLNGDYRAFGEVSEVNFINDVPETNPVISFWSYNIKGRLTLKNCTMRCSNLTLQGLSIPGKAEIEASTVNNGGLTLNENSRFEGDLSIASTKQYRGSLDGSGTVTGKVTNNGIINGNTFDCEVVNNSGGEIAGGTFKKKVTNNGGKISGGTFLGGRNNGDDSGDCAIEDIGGDISEEVSNNTDIIRNVQVTFDSCGGSAVESQKIPRGGSPAEPAAPVRDGYTFEGWYTESDRGTKVTDFSSLKLEKNTTFYAHWKQNAQPSPVTPDDKSTGKRDVTTLKASTAPKTGDENNLIIWIGLLAAAAAAGTAGLDIYRKKRTNKVN